jgi:formate hydrogenlyase transcriptional activator
MQLSGGHKRAGNGDQTESSDADAEVRSRETATAELIHHVPAFIQTADPQGNIDFLNDQWLAYTGITIDEAMGMGWLSAIHPDDRDPVIENWLGSIEDGSPVFHESRVRRFDGEYRWFLHRNVPIRDTQGNIIKWCGSSIDIEDRKQAELQVRRDEQELRQIIDLVPQQVFVLTTDGETVYSNRVALEYTGLTLDESLLAKAREIIYHPDDLDHLLADRCEKLARGEPFEVEARLQRHDGEYRWFLIRLNPIRDEEGCILHWYGTRTDIEERKQAEEMIRKENIALREEVAQTSMFEEVIGTSRAIKSVLSRVSMVAPTDSTVLLTGETGTGKELIARAIHKSSRRRDRAFISVNCAAIPQALIASELFGHEKGAFTGAAQRRLGRFELADGGTIFLDEVGDLPAETQVALLRVLQEQEIERVGGSRPLKIDVRVVAATNRDLDAAIAAGEFRSDLFYRLNVFPIEIPPLRERADDIPLLVGYFLDRYSRQVSKRLLPPERKTLDLLTSYSWPGNVRELQNVIQRSIIVCESDVFNVDESWLVSRRTQRAAPAGSLPNTLTSQEIAMIEAALADCRGRVAGHNGAATRLGMPVSTLESKIKSLNIDKHRFRSQA